MRSRKTTSKTGHIAGDRLARRGDDGLISLVSKRQRARAGQRAEQHRADDAGGILGRLIHVEQHQFFRCLAQRVQNRRIISPAIAQRCFLRHRIDPVRGSDQRGQIGTDETARHGAAGLHQFRSNDDIDIARRRHQRQHRHFAGGLDGGFGKYLDEIDGGAGALRHAGDGGVLRQIAVGFGEIDNPLRQHTAALAAQRHHRDGNGTGHATLLTARRCSQPMTPCRSRASRRSSQVGLKINSTRAKEGQSTAACATSPQWPQPTQLLST